MKLKSKIFFTILALGTLPLLVLVSINLQNHIHRHEESLQENIANRSALTSRAFTEKISKIETDLKRLATLHETQQLFRSFNQGDHTPLPVLDSLERIVNSWYGVDSKIDSIAFCTVKGDQTVLLNRDDSDATLRLLTDKVPDYLPQVLAKSAQSGFFIFEDSATPANSAKIILFNSAMINGNQLGKVIFEAPISLLVPDDTMIWLTPSGISHNFNSFQSATFGRQPVPASSAYEYTEALKLKFSTNRPFVWHTPNQHTISWLPISSGNMSSPLLWAGITVDKGAAQKWRRSLIINISIVIIATMFVIFCIANFIALKIDRIKQNILQGLDKILTNNQDVRFHWSGPKEITVLADELNVLAKRYFQTRSASLQTEHQLRESENKFRKLSSSAQDAIIMMDNNGDVAYWNRSAERMFGYKDNDAMGKPVHELLVLTRPEQPNTAEAIDLPLNNAPVHSDILELFAKRKDGSDIPIELSLSSTQIKNQWHAIWIVRDISERKQSEKEAELRRLQLVQTDKMRSLGLLVSGVAHEINNPNSIALLNTPMLTKTWHDVSPILESYYTENGDFVVAGLDYSEMRQHVPQLFAELMDSNKRIKNIVKDLKDYARKDKPTSTELLDINQIIETAIRLTHNLVKKTTSSFTTRLCSKCPQFNGNKQRLEQVIINLIQNACEALTNSHQSITVASEFEEKTSTIIISVHDEGAGIPEDTLSQLTDPFFTTKRNSGGTGLGLSVSAGIIKEHGGDLTFSSTLEQGTIAQVRLPVKELQ